jgi:peroxygenase
MYILLWPEDGRMSKEDVRGVFEGSIFYTIAEQHKTNRTKSSYCAAS